MTLVSSDTLMNMALSALFARMEPPCDVTMVRHNTELASRARESEVPAILFVCAPFMGRNATILVEEYRSLFPRSRIVIYADFTSSSEIVTCFRRGAAGCMDRTTGPEIMIGAIELVLSGGLFLPPSILGSHPRASMVQQADGSDVIRLSPRQMMVLEFLARGMSNREIAHELGVTEGTVKLHVHAILRAFRAVNRTEVAMRAIELGLVEAPLSPDPAGPTGRVRLPASRPIVRVFPRSNPARFRRKPSPGIVPPRGSRHRTFRIPPVPH